MFGESWATFTRKRNIYLVEKTYEEMSPDLQEFYLKLFNWLEFYKEDWQRVGVINCMDLHKIKTTFGENGIGFFLIFSRESLILLESLIQKKKHSLGKCFFSHCRNFYRIHRDSHSEGR